MIQEKVDSARQSGITDIKTVNAVEKDNLMHIFNFLEDMYDSAWAQATGEEDPGTSGNLRLTTEGLHTTGLFEQQQ